LCVFERRRRICPRLRIWLRLSEAQGTYNEDDNDNIMIQMSCLRQISSRAAVMFGLTSKERCDRSALSHSSHHTQSSTQRGARDAVAYYAGISTLRWINRSRRSAMTPAAAFVFRRSDRAKLLPACSLSSLHIHTSRRRKGYEDVVAEASRTGIPFCTMISPATHVLSRQATGPCAHA
jgi:hypothetical protein